MSLPTDLSPEQHIERGRRAAELLEDSILAEAFAEAREQMIGEWLAGETPAIREAAWAKVHGLDTVQHVLRRLVAGGEYAAEVLRRAQ